MPEVQTILTKICAQLGRRIMDHGGCVYDGKYGKHRRGVHFCISGSIIVGEDRKRQHSSAIYISDLCILYARNGREGTRQTINTAAHGNAKRKLSIFSLVYTNNKISTSSRQRRDCVLEVAGGGGGRGWLGNKVHRHSQNSIKKKYGNSNLKLSSCRAFPLHISIFSHYDHGSALRRCSLRPNVWDAYGLYLLAFHIRVSLLCPTYFRLVVCIYIWILFGQRHIHIYRLWHFFDLCKCW